MQGAVETGGTRKKKFKTIAKKGGDRIGGGGNEGYAGGERCLKAEKSKKNLSREKEGAVKRPEGGES